ncbi:MAG: ADP-glyceromanno-heptose 6-epimerase, partial [Cyclobacteriaceae bacterium]
MIVVTGANGFIGSWMVEKLNSQGFYNLVVVDDFHRKPNHNYLTALRYSESIDLHNLESWLIGNQEEVEFIIHLGAITDTTETDLSLLKEYNTDYSKMIWNICSKSQIPLIYASSAATYGAGEHGFSDDHSIIPKLNPLNAYAWSKHNFDLWALEQSSQPYYWAGLKFFNVYGPEREEHKGNMASMFYQIEKQIKEVGTVKLFKSNHPDYAHGEQRRDFIHVSEVVEKISNLMLGRINNGIFNLGTGKSRSFNEMVKEVSIQLNLKTTIEYIDLPKELSHNYQYFT